jgi:hypothetical protein
MKQRDQEEEMQLDARPDLLHRIHETPQGPKLYTKEEILDFAREKGREAARGSQVAPARRRAK